MKTSGLPSVGVLFGLLFLASLDNQVLIPVLPRIALDLGVSVERLAWLFSSYAGAAAAFNLLLGPLADRRNRVRLVCLGLLLFLVSGLGTMAVTSFAGLILMRGLTGLASGLIANCATALVADLFPYQLRGRVMGIVMSAYFAALVLGMPLSAWVAEQWGWRAIFAAAVILSTTLLALTASILPHPEPNQPRPGEGYFASYPRLLRSPSTSAALWSSFAVSGATVALFAFVSPHLDSSFGLRPLEISTVFLLAGVAALVASPMGGWWSDRWSKRGVFLVANTTLAPILPLFASVSWGISFWSLLFLVSLGIAFRQAALQTLQSELIPMQERGSFLALRNGLSQLGIASAVPIAGFLYGLAGYLPVTLVAAVFTLVGSTLIFLYVKEPVKAK